MADETPDNRPPDGPLPDEPRLDGESRPEGGAAPDSGLPRLPGVARLKSSFVLREVASRPLPLNLLVK